MAQYVPVENTVSAELRFLWAGQQVECGLNFLQAGGWEISDMDTLGAILVGAWETHCRPVTAPTCSLVEVYFTNLESEFSWTHSYTDNLPMAGTAGTGSAPNNVTLALSFGTAGRGRSFRGRIYPPGIAQGYLSGSTVIQSWQDAWIAFVSAVLGAVNVMGATISVVSRISNKQPRVAGLTTPITSFGFKNNVVDTQRRRLPGSGS